MTRQQLFEYCLDAFDTAPDYPFDDFMETAVFRHTKNRKWYALVMKVPKSRLGLESGEAADVLNLKLPPEMMSSFGASDGVYPAYHMNKAHWVSVLLEQAQDDLVTFLLSVSHSLTKPNTNKKPHS
ncbi:MAG: MmcQ/YjbR family DNA-binding protein [Clostridia bacterium]|nr:MmcQ/YjbR family DNA-binding protein [Clostridia bacterium]